MSNFIARFFAERRRKRELRHWRKIALLYSLNGESAHWIRAKITEYIDEEADYGDLLLKENQTKDDYIEEILSILD